MVYKDNSKELVYEQPNVKGYRLANTALNEIVKLEIKKGGEIPVHALPINVTFYVIAGEGVALVDEEMIVSSKGDVLFVNANSSRGWKNNDEKLLELLVIKQL